MARFFLLFFTILATVLADDPKKTDLSTKIEEMANFQKEVMKGVNETNENLKRLTRYFYEQVVQMRIQAEEQKEDLKRNFNESNQRLLELATIIDEHHQQAAKDNERFNHLENLVKEENNKTLDVVRRLDEKRESDREKLNDLAKQGERHFKLIGLKLKLKECPLALSADLKTASNGKRYSFIKTPQGNWEKGVMECNKTGLAYATLNNRIDLDAAFNEANKFGYNLYYVSAKNFGSGDKLDYRWLDGSKLDESSDLWQRGTIKTEGCVMIHPSQGSELLAGYCDETQSHIKIYFICELPAECY